MTPLQQAAQELVARIADLGASPLDWPEYTALERALEAEQAQAVEPVAWLVYVAEANNQYAVCDIDDQQLVDDCTNHNAEVTPLFTHPAPPATGERAELIAELLLLKFHVGGSIGDIAKRAADMLEADEQEIECTRKMYEKAHQGRADFRQAFREARKAQQVAVPVPMTGIEVLCAAKTVQSVFEHVPHRDVIEFVRAIEAHHGMWVKQ